MIRLHKLILPELVKKELGKTAVFQFSIFDCEFLRTNFRYYFNFFVKFSARVSSSHMLKTNSEKIWLQTFFLAKHSEKIFKKNWKMPLFVFLGNLILLTKVVVIWPNNWYVSFSNTLLSAFLTIEDIETIRLHRFIGLKFLFYRKRLLFELFLGILTMLTLVWLQN